MKKIKTNNYFNKSSEEKYLGKYFTSYAERFNKKNIKDNFIIEIKNVPGIDLLISINNVISILLDRDEKYWTDIYHVEIIKDQVFQTSICKITLNNFYLATYICELLNIYEKGMIYFENKPKFDDDFTAPYVLDDCKTDDSTKYPKTFNATISRKRLNKIFSLLLNSHESNDDILVIYNLYIVPKYFYMPDDEIKFAFDLNLSVMEEGQKVSILSILNQKSI